MKFGGYSFITTSFLFLLLAVHSLADGGYTPTEPEKESLLSKTIAVQGMVYCKSDPTSELVPLEGAVVRITCVAEDKYGIETAPFSFLSDSTDEKGYFFGTLCPSEVPHNKKIVRQCSAFLELSPLETCDVPTNINNGIIGSVLSSARLFKDNNVNLYSVGPFFYTSGPQPVSNNDGY